MMDKKYHSLNTCFPKNQYLKRGQKGWKLHLSNCHPWRLRRFTNLTENWFELIPLKKLVSSDAAIATISLKTELKKCTERVVF